MQYPQAVWGEVNSLAWWKKHASHLPHVAKMARQYLAAPATSAAVERLFSRAGRYHDALKKNTKDTNIETLLLVACNVCKRVTKKARKNVGVDEVIEFL